MSELYFNTYSVNWLDHGRTLREQGVEEFEMLLLRRKFFYSDQNVDSRDPVQLNLLYVQVRATECHLYIIIMSLCICNSMISLQRAGEFIKSHICQISELGKLVCRCVAWFLSSVAGRSVNVSVAL